MAKVTGPLMSLDASGTVAGTTTFSKWKGRNYVRLRVTPQNPQSANQQLTRGYLAVLAKAAHAVLTRTRDTMHVGSQFFQDAVSLAPTGQSWISWFQGTEHANVSTLKTAYLALSSTIRGYYDDAADDQALSAYITVGDTPVTYTKGFQVYLLAVFAAGYLGYTGFAAGADGTNATELGEFTTYVQTTT